jgi:hypothetical protein
MANDLDAFNDSMEKMTTENIQEKETTKTSTIKKKETKKKLCKNLPPH